ncbi:MAG: hypothetical protein K2Q12_05170 [Rickettsiales bacterium]|nr:hypothetical protein [Rickettsiales bacterium]
MSRDYQVKRPHALVIIWLALIPCLLAGCGFSPVYGTRAAGGTSQTLAQVQVLPAVGRVGQLFTAALEDKLNPNAEGQAIRYELQPTINVQLVPISIALDGTVARFRVLYDTSYTLYDRELGKQIKADRIHRSSSYEVINDADFSTYAAEQDAVAHGLDELSQDYFLRVSAFLRRYERETGQAA